MPQSQCIRSILTLPPSLSFLTACRYYAYGFGSTATTATERAQLAYLFFQVLTLVLSMTCAFICHALLFYIYHRPSTAFADAFADSVKTNVRIVFRLVLLSHITYCCALVLVGFVYFPNEPFALYLCVAVFSLLLAYVRNAAPYTACVVTPVQIHVLRRRNHRQSIR